jgi:hypothetical protein
MYNFIKVLKVPVYLILLAIYTLICLNAAIAQNTMATKDAIRELITEYIATESKTGTKMIGLGSWISGGNYRDPLTTSSGVPSDHDMRMFMPEGTSDHAAFEEWRKAQNWIKTRVKERFGKDSDEILKSINIYPPDQLMKDFNSASDAKRTFANVYKSSPNLGGAEPEGLFSKASKGWKQNYEAKKGVVIYQDPKSNKVFTSNTSLEHMSEGYGKFTLNGMADLTDEWIEHLDDAIGQGDPQFIKKYLERMDESLAKGKNLGRSQHDDYIRNLIKRLDKMKAGDAIDDELLAAIKAVRKKAAQEARMLRLLNKTTNPRNIEMIYAMFEPKNTKWKRFKNAVFDIADEIPIDTVLQGIFVAFDAYQSYDAYASGDPERALREAMAAAMSSVALGPGILATITNAIIEDAKENGYSFVTNPQDCEDLLVGICEGVGRAGIVDKKMKDYTLENIINNLQPINTQEFTSLIQAHLQVMAHQCTIRGHGEFTNEQDRKAEQTLYDRCIKTLPKKWNEMRIKKMGDVAMIESDLIGTLQAGNVGLNAEPNPVKLPKKEEGKKSTATVNVIAIYDIDNKATSALYDKLYKALRPLGGKEHLAQIQLECLYIWTLDGKEISKEKSFYSGGLSELLEQKYGEKQFTFDTAGSYKVDFEFQVKINFISAILPVDDDVVSQIVEKLNMEQIITKSATVDIKVEEEEGPQGTIKIVGPEKLSKGMSETLKVELGGDLKQLKDININWYFEDKTGEPDNYGTEIKYQVPEDKEKVTVFVTVTDQAVSGIGSIASSISEALTGKKIEIKVLAEDSKTFEISFKSYKDQIEEAYKNSDWKKLIEYAKNDKYSAEKLSPEEIKLAQDYLQKMIEMIKTKYQKHYDEIKAKNDQHEKAYESFASSLASKKKSLAGSKDYKAIVELDQCDMNADSKYEMESNRFKSTLEGIKYFLDSLNKFNPAQPYQSYIFEEEQKLPLNLALDITKPIEIPVYKGFCEDKNAQENVNKIKVELRALKTKLKQGEMTDIAAKLSYYPRFCPDALTYTWTGSNFGGNNTFIEIEEVTFVASKEGSYDIGVTVSCMDSELGSDSITLTVGGAATGKIIGLNREEYFGSRKEISARLDIPAGGKTSVLWDSTPNLTFEPKESIQGNTKVTFDRMENPVKIWAQILQDKDGSSSTVGEVEQEEVTVISPEFKIIYDVLQKDAKIGQTVTAEIQSEPYVDPSLIDYRWVEPVDRKEVGTGRIEFVPKDTKPIKLKAIARVPGTGDSIHDDINDTYTPGSYKVIARVIGPKYDMSVKVWNEKKGLIEVTKEYTVDQDIIIEADIEDAGNIELRYDWSVNDGCSIVGVDNSKQLTVNRHEVGTCIAKIEVFDKDKNKLGEAEATVDITVSQEMIDKAAGKTPDDSKENKNSQSDQAKDNTAAINKINEEANTLVEQGKVDDALSILEGGLKKYPGSDELEQTIEKLRNTKTTLDSMLESCKKLADQKKFSEAQKELDNAKAIQPKYQPVVEAEKYLKEKITENKYLEKIKESKQMSSQGKLDEALANLKTLTPGDLKKPEVVALIKDLENEINTIKSKSMEFNRAIASAEYEKAEQLLAELNGMKHPNYKTIVDANAIWKGRQSDRIRLAGAKLQEAKELSAEGNLEEAIAKAEEGFKVDKDNQDLKSFISKTRSDIATLTKQIDQAHEFIKKENYQGAESALGAANAINGQYPPLRDAYKKLNEARQKAASDAQMVNGKIQQAKWAVDRGDLDEALGFLEEALKLESNNHQARTLRDKIQQEKDQITRIVINVKSYLSQNKIEVAKAELKTAQQLHPKYPPVSEAEQLIEAKSAAKNKELQNKVDEASQYLSNQDYKHALEVVNMIRAHYVIDDNTRQALKNIEDACNKAIGDKQSALNCLRTAEQQYNNYDYAGAIANIDMGLGTYSYVWGPNDNEPSRYSMIRSDAMRKNARINELMNKVTPVVQNSGASQSDLQIALSEVNQVLVIQPPHNQALSYKQILEGRLNKNSQSSQVSGNNNVVPVGPAHQNTVVPVVPHTNSNSIVPIAPVGVMQGVVPVVPAIPQSNQQPVYQPSTYQPPQVVQQSPVYTPQTNRQLPPDYNEIMELQKKAQKQGIYISVLDEAISNIQSNQQSFNQGRQGHTPSSGNGGYTLPQQTFDTGKSNNSTSIPDGTAISVDQWPAGNTLDRIKTLSQKSSKPSSPCNTPCNTSSNTSTQKTKQASSPSTVSTSVSKNYHGRWDMVANVNYRFNLDLTQINNRIEGTMTRTNGTEPVDKIQGEVLSDGSIKFTRFRQNSWKQHYTGRMVSSGGKTSITGNFNMNGQGNYGWHADKLSTGSTSVSSVNSPPASLVGKWYVVACGYSANMEISNTGSGMIGKINYHELGYWENVINIQYNSSTGEVSFKREKYPQIHTGKVTGNKMSGTLVRQEVPGNLTCDWTATRQ